MTGLRWEHHQLAMDDLVGLVASEGAFQAVITSGSIAKGTARATSDLDVYLVVDDDNYAERKSRHDLAFITPCTYDGGYIDGKVISVGVLRATAEHGSEPMRSSFTGSTVIYSVIGDLQPAVDRIAVYPEANRAGNMRDFFSHFAIYTGYFAPQAMAKDDPFLLSHSLSLATLFAGRLVLAYNRVLYPCPKQLLATVGSCSEQPEDFVGRTKALLRGPTEAALQDYRDLLANFTDWGIGGAEVLTRFMELDEWSWLDGEPALAQR